jgi:hypothetical protein
LAYAAQSDASSMRSVFSWTEDSDLAYIAHRPPGLGAGQGDLNGVASDAFGMTTQPNVHSAAIEPGGASRVV